MHDGSTSQIAGGFYEITAPTEVAPSLGPWLTISDDPRSSMVINFTTDAALRTTVVYGAEGSEQVELTEELPINYHHVLLTGLTPDTLYTYFIRFDSTHRSPDYRFRTGPEPGTPFSFAVMSDMQDNGADQRWRDIALEVAQNHHEVRFVLAPGDLGSESLSNYWHTFFTYGAELLARVPFMPVPGNHDTPGNGSSTEWSLFASYFDFETTNLVYEFCYASACFVALNSEASWEFYADQGAQYIYTAGVLDSWFVSVHPAFSFAYWHKPPYNVGVRHYAEQGEFRDITGLFEDRLDWVFAGHEHLYQRFKPMKFNGLIAPSGIYGQGPDDGVGYMVLPPAGNYPESEVLSVTHEKGYYRDRVAYPDLSGDATIVPSELGFVIVTIDGRTITLTTYGMGTLTEPLPAHIIDTVTYQKP